MLRKATLEDIDNLYDLHKDVLTQVIKFINII